MASNVHDEKVKSIDRIEFDVWDNQKIRDYSALDKDTVGVDMPELYDNSEPKRGGLIDPRFGTTGHGECATCGYDSTHCIGHFGHIELAEAVFHMGYSNYVKKILSCICIKCSKLLVYKNEEEIAEMLRNKSSKARFAEIRNLVKGVSHCSKTNYGCGTKVSKIRLDCKKTTGAINIISETDIAAEEGESVKKKIRHNLTPEICYDILKNISDTDCMILGLDPKRTRPESMIHKIFPVPPVAVRPSAKVDFMDSATKEDDLTHKLSDIIKANIRIRKYKESAGENTTRFAQDYVHLLQYHVGTYFDNETMCLPRAEQRNKLSKSISSRLKGKDGRIRGNLMGKRVDFSARSVITPDPNIDINQLGVPRKVAMNLTFPEIVTPSNIAFLQQLVRNGRDKYPGANFVFPMSNAMGGRRVLPIDLRYRKEKVELQFGDVVERHIVNDDYVLLNRQPTLHKLSMMGHRIKVIDDDMLNTFRLSVAATTPYNADFDGDEMNIFLPQSIQTQIELEEIADVKKQIITPRDSVPIIGIIQDGLLGAYNLTQPHVKIHWKDAMNIMSYTSLDDLSVLKKDETYDGKQLVSLIIPSRISTKSGGIEVKNGVMTKGSLSKAMLGPKKGNSLVHLIWDEYGADQTREFIDDIQRLVNNFNLENGFTVGIGDIDIPEKVEKEIHTVLQTKKVEIDHLITEVENNPELLTNETFEQMVINELDTIRDNISKMIMENLKPDNNFNIMNSSGSKGDPINMGQMGGCIGQQIVEGKRIKPKFGNRTLAYFPQHDDTAEARGFVTDPFYKGINPIGFIFHNMASREGLIDTAIKTAESGYIQRRLVKSMEDISIKNDCTVRNANNTIVQMIYGDCGIDTTRQYKFVIKILEMGNREMEEKFGLSSNELVQFKNFPKEDNDRYLKMLMQLRDNLRKSKIKLALNNITFSPDYFIPVNLRNIINNLQKQKTEKDEPLNPEYIIRRLDDILDYQNTKVSCLSDDIIKNRNSLKYQDEMLSKLVFKLALHEHLGPKISIYELGLNRELFDRICNQIMRSFNRSVVEPGEMVGIISAQSIGEPVTQMSCVYGTNIQILGDILFDGPIGQFIDWHIERCGPQTCNGNTIIDFPDDENFLIASVDSLGTVKWSRISQVSRHPANGSLVKIYTSSGRTTQATASHSFLCLQPDGYIGPVLGSELLVGDYVPVARSLVNNLEMDIIPGIEGLVADIYRVLHIPFERRGISTIRADLATKLELFEKASRANLAEDLISRLRNIVNSDVVWDKIVDIQVTDGGDQMVYDFTVPGSESFMVDCGIFVHNTLNTFHHAGIGGKGTASLGVPRVKELLSFSKTIKTPKMEIYMDRQYRESSLIAYKIASHLKLTQMKDLRTRADIFYDPSPSKDQGMMAQDKVYNVFYSHNPSKAACQADFTNLPWVIRLELDKEKMFEKDITLLDIKTRFCNNWENRYTEIKGIRKEERVLLEKITQCSILSNSDSARTPIMHIRFDMTEFDFSVMIDFLDVFVDNFKLKGVDGITHIDGVVEEQVISFDNSNAEPQKLKQNVIYTSGVNMVDIRYMRGIDLNKTTTNDVMMIYETFGIEATRMVLLKEFKNLFQINYQHVSILVDIMTNNGTPTSIDRHGFNRIDTDPLARASFEKTVDQLLQAAVFGEIDHMRSVSSRIMAGLAIEGGTGLCQVVLDTELLQNSEFTEEIEQKYHKTYNELSENLVIKDVIEQEADDIFMPE